jgi:hypothetical protein
MHIYWTLTLSKSLFISPLRMSLIPWPMLQKTHYHKTKRQDSLISLSKSYLQNYGQGKGFWPLKLLPPVPMMLHTVLNWHTQLWPLSQIQIALFFPRLFLCKFVNPASTCRAPLGWVTRTAPERLGEGGSEASVQRTWPTAEKPHPELAFRNPWARLFRHRWRRRRPGLGPPRSGHHTVPCGS